jgi:hypothetical protein
MPLERRPRRSLACSGHGAQLLPVVRRVALAVVPLAREAAAHPHAQVGRDRHVALVEEGVELLREEQAVLHVVGAGAQVGLDVHGVEHDLGVLAGDRVAAALGVEEARAERALAFAAHVAREGEAAFVVGGIPTEVVFDRWRADDLIAEWVPELMRLAGQAAP